MEYYSLYGFSFESGSLQLSAQDELGLSETQYEQWQRSFEFDIGVWLHVILGIWAIQGLTFQQAFMPLPPPNDRYEARQMAAAQRITLQNDRTQDFDYQHAGRINDTHEDLHQSQFIGWDSNSGTRVESSADVFRHEPQYLSDLPDESMGQILCSDSYHYRLDPGLNIFGHTISPESEIWVPPTTIAHTSEGGNYSFRVMVESEEEYSQEEDIIFDVASEEESTDDERGFEGDDEGSDGDDGNGDDEDSDTLMDEGEGEDEDEGGAEPNEENGEDIHMPEEVSMRISRSSIFNRNAPAIFYDEEIWEVEWPSGAWRNAFNRTEQN